MNESINTDDIENISDNVKFKGKLEINGSSEINSSRNVHLTMRPANNNKLKGLHLSSRARNYTV